MDFFILMLSFPFFFLSNFRIFLVRSYGTEDRDGQFAIPPQDEIFDYILFRGSDIKDIRVVNNVPRVPHDPAIMQMHVSTQNQPNFQPQFSMPVMPHVGGQVGPFGGNNQPSPFSALTTPNAQGGQLPQGTPGLPFGQQQQPSQQSQQTPQQAPNSQQQQQSNNQQQQKSKLNSFHRFRRPFFSGAFFFSLSLTLTKHHIKYECIEFRNE